MPRYFFNTRLGDELIEGAEGGLLNATLEVTDDRGEIVLEFPFTEAILGDADEPVTRH
jgi:hypothetical protein